MLSSGARGWAGELGTLSRSLCRWDRCWVEFGSVLHVASYILSMIVIKTLQLREHMCESDPCPAFGIDESMNLVSSLYLSHTPVAGRGRLWGGLGARAE